MAETLQQTLAGFGVPVEVVSVERGPAVTRFGVKPGMTTRAGRTMRVKVSSILALRSDLALALAVPAVRVEAPVPGQAMVGIEVPNSELRAVALRGVLEDRGFKQLRRASTLALALGRDVSGAAVVADLAVMPHLLIAGTTGSGKSICINAVLASLLFQNTPDSLRLLLVDPKRVELARFGRLPHLIAPVVTDPREAVGALRWVVQELERRYRRLAEQGVRDRAGYNARLAAGQAPMAALVVVIDELADLMLTAAGDTEPALMRLAQLGRATGLHLIVATQRPSTDVITGVIKANFPARIAFAVASGTDSRVILDTPGAERLLGRGDMLFLAPEAPAPRRVQGVLVGDEELGRLVGFWAAASGPPPAGAVPWQELVPPASPDEALYEAARALARSGQPVTASLLARRLRIGHARARALFDRLIEEGEIDDSAGEADGGDLGTNLSWVDDEFEGRP
jgi:S-DNA-T family DNA segregation ATPase FtsK/SpoIIIE